MKKYRITNLYGNTYRTNEPSLAIAAWFIFESKDRLNAAIFTYDFKDAVTLLEYAKLHPELIEKCHSKYHCSYRKDFLLESLDIEIKNNGKGFLGNEEFPDQIYPFCFG